MTGAIASPTTRPAAGREHRSAGRCSVVALGGWAVVVAVSAGSLVGVTEVRGGIRILLPLLVGSVLVAVVPRVTARLSWRGMLGVVVVAAAAWAVSLALMDGAGSLTTPLESRYDYLRNVPLVGDSPRAFLETFTERIGDYSTHVQAHPPGFLLALSALDRAGLGGAGWVAALLILAGASSVAAAAIALRELAGEDIARRTAPYLALAPAAIWVATSADALYMGVGSWGVALLILATGRSGIRSDLGALGGGLVLGAGLFLTYGLVPLGVVPAAVAAARGRVRPVVVAAFGVALVTAAFAIAGFWWLDGLRATGERYAAGAAQHRFYARFLITNVGAFAIALGPALAVALAGLRDRRVWLLAGGALVAVAIADLSGLSKGEVERIWLPFVPWAMTACAALAGRGWLALQAVTGLVIQVVIRSPW